MTWREAADEAIAHNIADVLENGPRLAWTRKTAALAIDRQNKCVLQTGLGAMGVGTMWVDYSYRDDEDPEWADLPEQDSTGQFGGPGSAPWATNEPIAEHLKPRRSDRGFVFMPLIPSRLGGYVNVYESSSATEPSVWLYAEAPINMNEPKGPRAEAHIELTVDDAERLADQLRFLVEHHYQTCDRVKREQALERAPLPDAP